MPVYHLRHHAAERLRATHGLAWVQWKPQHWLIAHDGAILGQVAPIDWHPGTWTPRAWTATLATDRHSPLAYCDTRQDAFRALGADAWPIGHVPHDDIDGPDSSRDHTPGHQ